MQCRRIGRFVSLLDLGRSAAADLLSSSSLVGLQIPDSLVAFLNPASPGEVSRPVIIGAPADVKSKSVSVREAHHTEASTVEPSSPTTASSAQSSRRRVAFNTPLSPKQATPKRAVGAQSMPSDITASAFYANVGVESAVLLNDSVLLTAYPTGTGTMADAQKSTIFAPVPQPPPRMPPSDDTRAIVPSSLSSGAPALPALLPWLFGASGPESEPSASATPDFSLDNFVIGAGIGYACLLISVLASYLDILLPFPIQFFGSRPFVVDTHDRFASTCSLEWELCIE
jgi:hypothetical protein